MAKGCGRLSFEVLQDLVSASSAIEMCSAHSPLGKIKGHSSKELRAAEHIRHPAECQSEQQHLGKPNCWEAPARELYSHPGSRAGLGGSWGGRSWCAARAGVQHSACRTSAG